MTHNEVVIATNNGDIGGGEVMLLALASHLRALGCSVHVVAPSEPSAVVDSAREQGIPTVVLPAATRRQYMVQLRRWRRMHPEPLLWCNGLVPALATAGTARRVVHLHQSPSLPRRPLVWAARVGALATVVPSEFVSRRVRGALVLYNWVEETPKRQSEALGDAIRIGFLGRPSQAKGVDVLAEALREMETDEPGRYRLLLAGEPRFVGPREQAAVAKALEPVSHLVDAPGWLPSGQFFQSVDILVCPSVAPEAFGLVVAEAMSARVPVVVSDAGALPEVVGDAHPWIVPRGDAIALAKTLQTVAMAFGRSGTNAGIEPVLDRAYHRWMDSFSPGAGKNRLRDLLQLFGMGE